MTGWSVFPDSGFEIWDSCGGTAADGGQCLEPDVNTCNTSSQTIATTAAHRHVISLASSARPGFAGTEVEARWNGVVVGSASADGTGQGQVNWAYHTVIVPGAAGSSLFQLTNLEACDGLGAKLDDVSVVEAPALPALDPHGLALLVDALARPRRVRSDSPGGRPSLGPEVARHRERQ